MPVKVTSRRHGPADFNAEAAAASASELAASHGNEILSVSALPQAELVSNQYDAQRVALETMAVRLSSLQYPTATDSGQSAQNARNNR